MQKIIVIVGPTGVGKTKLSIELAKHYNGEVINADSMQIYKNLNIGTAKITEEEKENIPHHLFDIKSPEEEYSIYNYQTDCRSKINEILKKNKTPILVGGTGLYIKSALYDYKLIQNKKATNYENIKTEDLYKKLISLDPKSLDKIDKHNRRRVENALNYYKENNSSITENKTNTLLYNAIFIGLTTSRENLYQIINKRVDQMIKNGLIEEVETFYKKNIRTKPLLNGIGYKELYNYLDNKINLDTAIDEIKKDSRHYAKRQYTFFKHQFNTIWFNTNYDNFNETVKEVCTYIDSH